MKKLFLFVLVITLSLCALCFGASAAIQPTKPQNGDGSSENPYQITTAAELYWFAEHVNSGNPSANAKLTADITINTNVLNSNGDLIGKPANEWTPIGSYSGTFDGNGKTIYGLYLSETFPAGTTAANGERYTGMFRKVEGGIIKNLNIVDSYVAGVFSQKGASYGGFKSYAGGICGYADADSEIKSCSFEGTLHACSTDTKNIVYAGGICGRNEGSLSELVFNGKLTVENNSINGQYETMILSYGGGICGSNTGTVEDCNNSGEIVGTGYNTVVGGICGESLSEDDTIGTIRNCKNTGKISSITWGGQGNTCYAGGICGMGSVNIVSCQNGGSVLGANYAGGISGTISRGQITSCTNSAIVEGYYQHAGGICGFVSTTATISACANFGDVKLSDTSQGGSETGLGGICGGMNCKGGKIVNCYNAGSLTGYQEYDDVMRIGGICGRFSYDASTSNVPVSILNCCNIGSITYSALAGTVTVGGVCGIVNEGVSAENCFWLDRDGTGSADTGAMIPERFARGEAAGLLNRWSDGGYNGKVWKVGQDGYPVLYGGENSVVEVKFVDFLTYDVLMTCYTNAREKLKGIDSIVFDDGTTLTINGNELPGKLQELGFMSDLTIVVDGGLRYALTATVTGSVSKVYDGTVAVTNADGLKLELSGIMTGDEVGVSAVKYNFDSANAGSKSIEAESITLSGKDAGKYALAAADVSCSVVTAEITRRPITASIDGTVSKEYDGNADMPEGHSLSITFNANDIIGSDEVTATAASYVYDNKNAGEDKAVTASGIMLDGAAAGNYSLSSTTATGTVGEITQRTVTPSIDGTVTKVYDGNTNAPSGLSIALDRAVAGDNVTATASSYAYDNANVGEGKTITASGITLSGSDAGNYTLSVDTAEAAVGAITRKTVTITADDKTAERGDAMPTLTCTVTGLADGESLTEEPVLSCNTDMTVAGKFTITVTGGSAGGNYTLERKNGTLTVANRWLVSVKPGNGSADESSYIKPGESFPLPAAPSKSGYIFMGWTDGENTRQPGDKVDITSDTTFRAVWANMPDITPDEPDEFPFTDVPEGAWYYDAVCYVWANGIMEGVEADKFAPNSPLTRAMVWAVLARIDGVEVSGDSWMTVAQKWAVNSGVSDGTNPTGCITREQLVTMLWRYKGSPVVEYTLTAPDASDISDWALDAMKWAASTGLIEGDDLGNLNPTSNSTRAHAATFFMRYLEK